MGMRRRARPSCRSVCSSGSASASAKEQQEQYDPPFYRAEGIEYGHRGRPKRHQPHQQDARRQAPLQEFVAVVEVAPRRLRPAASGRPTPARRTARRSICAAGCSRRLRPAPSRPVRAGRRCSRCRCPSSSASELPCLRRRVQRAMLSWNHLYSKAMPGTDVSAEEIPAPRVRWRNIALLISSLRRIQLGGKPVSKFLAVRRPVTACTPAVEDVVEPGDEIFAGQIVGVEDRDGFGGFGPQLFDREIQRLGLGAVFEGDLQHTWIGSVRSSAKAFRVSAGRR